MTYNKTLKKHPMNELSNFIESLSSLNTLKLNYVEIITKYLKENNIDEDEYQDLIILFQFLDKIDK